MRISILCLLLFLAVIALSSPDPTFKKKKLNLIAVYRKSISKRNLDQVESEIVQLEKRSPTVKRKKNKDKFIKSDIGNHPALAKRSSEENLAFGVETKVKRDADPTFKRKKKKKLFPNSPGSFWKRTVDDNFEEKIVVKRSPNPAPTLKAKKSFQKSRKVYRSPDSEDDLQKSVGRSKRSPTFKKSKKFKLFSRLWKRSVDEKKTKRSADAEPTLLWKKKMFVSPPSYFPHYYYTKSFW